MQDTQDGKNLGLSAKLETHEGTVGKHTHTHTHTNIIMYGGNGKIMFSTCIQPEQPENPLWVLCEE